MAPKSKLPPLALALALTGCMGLPLPTAYTVAPGLTTEQAAAIDTAHDAWCAAVGYCPELVPWPGSAETLTWVTTYDRAGADRGMFAYQTALEFCGPGAGPSECELREAVAINRAHGVYRDPEFRREVWVMAATHEIGHLCIDGHPADLSDGIMREVGSLEHDAITPGTAEAFMAGCGL